MPPTYNNQSGGRFFKIGALLILSASLLVGSVILSRTSHTRSDELAFEDQGVIYTADRNGLNLTRVTEFDLQAFSPSWSPDGQRIAFVGEPFNAPYVQNSVYILNLADSKIERLTSSEEIIVYQLDWSPDGKTIAFYGPSSSGARWKLYLLDVGSKQLRLLAENLVSPKWSPDGKSLVAIGDNQVCVLRIDSSSKHCYTFTEVEDPDYPFWSPDGSRIGFIGSQSGGNGLYTIASDGSDLHALPNSVPLGLCDPTWLPNEDIIFLADCAENSTGMYVYDLKTLQFSHLILFARTARSPSWKPMR